MTRPKLSVNSRLIKTCKKAIYIRIPKRFDKLLTYLLYFWSIFANSTRILHNFYSKLVNSANGTFSASGSSIYASLRAVVFRPDLKRTKTVKHYKRNTASALSPCSCDVNGVSVSNSTVHTNTICVDTLNSIFKCKRFLGRPRTFSIVLVRRMDRTARMLVRASNLYKIKGIYLHFCTAVLELF